MRRQSGGRRGGVKGSASRTAPPTRAGPGAGGPTVRAVRRPALPLLIALLALAGCDDGADQDAQAGARGPLVMRIWDREARAVPGAAPTTLVAMRAEQRGLGEEVRLREVLVRRPLEGAGALYVHAAEAVAGDGRGVVMPGPVHLTGMWRGLPFTGTADQARIPSNGHLELTELRLARGGTLVTAPLLTALREQVAVTGALRALPGAPAANAALAALPPDLPLPMLGR